MSRIEDVLKKLQSSGGSPPARAVSSPRGVGATSAVPQARKKKVTIDGDKYPVSQQALIEGGLLAPLDQALSIADEFRRVKRPLIANALRMGDEAVTNGNVIMIASGLPGAGKTFCTVNLAVSISLERELNVLLVDADVPKPHISREFGLGDAPGLIDLLLEEKRDLNDVLVRTDLNDIQVLPAGRQHPQATELLSSERMSLIVNELARRYSDRIILLDSPPLLVTTEAQALASQVGQIALVVEAGRTSEQVLRQTLEVLDPDKAVNIILNKSPDHGRGGYYGGYYGGGYGYYGHEAR